MNTPSVWCTGGVPGRVALAAGEAWSPYRPCGPVRSGVSAEEDGEVMRRHEVRRIREIAARWHTRIHSDAFRGKVRLAAQDADGGEWPSRRSGVGRLRSAGRLRLRGARRGLLVGLQELAEEPSLK